jgi:hypothetical protein
MAARCVAMFWLVACWAGCIALPDYGDEGQPCFGNGTCKTGLECIEDICVGCLPQCEDRCSPASDGCGGSCPADCPSGSYCTGSHCLPCDTNEHCGAECQDCTESTGICFENECCYPDCTNRECGTDGCDGTCGNCLSGQSCIITTGQCFQNDPPQIIWDDIGGRQLDAGTHQVAISVSFSEPVSGLGTGGVTIDGGAFLSGFTTQDAVTWTFQAVGLRNTASFSIEFNEGIQDEFGAPLQTAIRDFTVADGLKLYVVPNGNGSGATPGDPTNMVNAIVTATAGTDILVAQGTYTTFIEMVPGVSLFCGFSSNFQQRNPQAYTTTIDQVTLYATASVLNSEGVTRRIIDGCVLKTSYTNEPSVVVDIGNGANPVISQCRIINKDAPKSIGIRLRNSGASILNNNLENDASLETTEYTGMLISEADNPQIFGNWVDAGSGPGPSTCISTTLSDGLILENILFGGGGAGPGSTHPSVGLRVEQGSPSIVNNLIHAGANREHTSGISCGSGSALISHNTVFAGEGSLQSIAIEIQDDQSSPVIVNNILFGDDTGICIREQGATADPSSCQNNFVFGCSEGLYFNEGSFTLLTASDIDNLDGEDIQDGVCTPGADCEHSRYGGNLASIDLADILFEDPSGLDSDMSTLEDNDWRLKTIDPDIIGGGKSTFGNDCGSQENATSCGDVIMDLDSNWRTTPVTPGAYEQD